MYILGLNAYHGDSSACLFKDDKLIFAIEEERLRRIKHWAGFPILSIKAALKEANISIFDIDHITISRDPAANWEKKLLFSIKRFKIFSSVLDRLKNYRKIFSIKDILAQEFGIEPQKIKAQIHWIEHHRSHLASTFYVSGFQKAALLSIDGFGDFTSTMIAMGEANDITIFDTVNFPHSLGIFYTAITQFLGFHKYGDEYKVMGLASYGKPSMLDKMQDIVILTDNGLFELNQKYFKHSSEGVSMTWENGYPHIEPLFSDYMIKKLGKPRQKDEPITDYHKDLAASAQKMTELTIFHILNSLYDKVKIDNLCIAGGVGQNSVANGKIALNTPFKNIYLPPAATDAGTAIGSALWFIHNLQRKKTTFIMRNANWGQKFSDQQILAAIQNKNLSYVKLPDEQLNEQVVNALIDGAVVGWFQDRSEFGPRALGYRSILVDPRRTDAKDLLNTKIKKREKFRPFAPSILAEFVGEYFEQTAPVPFMEKVYVIKPEKRNIIPAVTHVDGTGRLQTVEKTINPKYYDLIYKFYLKTGVPILLNTSFNENEPIVNTPQEAIDTFLRTKMDVLVLENFLIRRSDIS